MDRVGIRDITARGRHGWTSEERATPQSLRIDLELHVDLQRAGLSDELGDTVDYAAIHRRVVEIVTTSSYALLETLGAAILAAIFEDRRVVRADLRIAKPELLDGATPSVTLHRENSRAND